MNKRTLNILNSLFLCSLLTLSGRSFAQNPSEKHVSPIVDSRKKLLEKIDTASRAVEEETKRRIESERENKTKFFKDFYDAKIETLKEKSEHQNIDLIEAINDFTEKHPDSPKTPDALLNLAQIYFEEAENKYRRDLENFYRTKDPDSSGAELPKKDLTHAISTLENISRFPSFKHMDVTLYLLGYAYLNSSKDELAEASFTRLINNYPQSPYAEESIVRIGEYYFSRKKFSKAINAYLKVLTFREKRFYDKALYKLAWSYYLTKNYTQAIARFIDLLEYHPESEKKAKLLLEFKNDAEMYIAFSLLRKNDLNKSLAFLKTISHKPYAYNVLKNLGDIYLDRGLYKQSVTVYRTLISRYPYSPDNPLAHASLMTDLELLYVKEDIYGELAKISAFYKPGSMWRGRNDGNEESNRKADALLEKSLYALAVFMDKEGRTKNDGKLILEAVNYYKNLIEIFPRSEKSYNAQFYIAEAYLVLGQLDRSLASYDAVLRNNYFKRYFTEALYSEVVVYDKIFEEKDLSEWEKIAIKQEKELPALPEKLVKACDHFVLKAPDDRRVPGVIYRSGDILARFHQNEQAQKRFEYVMKNFSETSHAVDAFRQILNLQIASADWEQVVKTGESYITNPFVQDEKLRSEVEQIIATADYKKGEQLEREGKFIEAGDHLSLVAVKYSGTPIVDSAIADAFENYKKSPDRAKALEGMNKLIDEHPKSKILAAILLELGDREDEDLNFPMAKFYYSKAIEKSDPSTGGAALLRLATIYEMTGDGLKAGDFYVRYASATKESDVKREAYLKGIINYAESENFQKIVAIQKDVEAALKKDLAKLAMLYLLLAEDASRKGKSKKFSAYLRLAEKSIDRTKIKAKEVNNLLYKLKLENLSSDIEKFNSIELAFPRKTFFKAFERKALLTSKLEKNLVGSIKSAPLEYSSQALYYLGSIYENFGDSLLKTDIPETLPKDEKQRAKTEIEKIAVPLLRRARSAYMKNIALSKQRKFHNKWVEQSTQRFASMIHSETMLANLKLQFKYKQKDDIFTYPIIEKPLSLSNEKPKTDPSTDLFESAVLIALKKDLLQDDFKRAISLFDKAFRQNKTLREARFNKAVLLQKTGRLEESRLVYYTLAQDPITAQMAEINLAAIYIAEGNLDKPLEIYKNHLKITPDDLNVLSNLAFLERKNGNLERSLEISRKVLRISPSDERAYNNMALIFEKKGQPKLAQTIFQRGLAKHPGSILLLNNFGIFHILRGDLAKAYKNFTEVNKTYPHERTAILNTAYILLKTQNNEEGLKLVKSLWDKSYKRGPHLYLNLGLAYMSVRQTKEALKHINTNLELAGPFYKEAELLISKLKRDNSE